MDGWSVTSRDLKRYPHFDSPLSPSAAEALARDPARVARHTFYPFMLFTQRWNRFAAKGGVGKVKERPIRYAARRDAHIFSYYRHLLSELYEAELIRRGLSECVLAYRKVKDPETGKGKCNIEFARDAIQAITQLGDCCVLTLDISSFFESLDHVLLKEKWGALLGVDRLPPDHFKVYKAITSYAVVDKKEAYERLQHFGVKGQTAWGTPKKGYLTAFRNIPTQLCTGVEFRERIAGDGNLPSIIRRHRKPFGIPQGAPISDLLANLYLMDFDAVVHRWATELGGSYHRYSDDILIVARGDESVGRRLLAMVQEEIRRHGSELKIKTEKSSVFVFERRESAQDCRLVLGTQGRNGLEYLGFRYDGARVYIRDATLSRLRSKVALAARKAARAEARRYPDKNANELKRCFDYESLISRFGRVEDFSEASHDYRKWTFWTYVMRAAKSFGSKGHTITRQLRRHRTLVRARMESELERAVAAR